MPLDLGPPVISSGYCLRSDIEDVFGPKNVFSYADKDRDKDPLGTKVPARIARAITASSALINAMLGGGVYTIPLVYLGVVEPIVVDWCSKLSGMWLYNSSGLQDTVTPGADDPIANQYRTMMKEVKNQILMAKSGLIRLTAQRSVSGNPIQSYTPSGSNSINSDLAWQAYASAFWGF